MHPLIIGNQSGSGWVSLLGQTHNEGECIAAPLRRRGLHPDLMSPNNDGFHLRGVKQPVIICPQSVRSHDALGSFVQANTSAEIYWRPGWSQMEAEEGFVSSILSHGNVAIIQLCQQKARSLIGKSGEKASLVESAHILSGRYPGPLWVVTHPMGAAACMAGGGVIHVPTQCVETEVYGIGANFFGGFLAALWEGNAVPVALAAGHRIALAVASGQVQPECHPLWHRVVDDPTPSPWGLVLNPS